MKRRRPWGAVCATAAIAFASSGAVVCAPREAFAGESIVHDIDAFVLRTTEVSPAPCVFLHTGKKPDPFGDCDPPPPKMWLQGQPNPAERWLADRLGPWTPLPGAFVAALHFRGGTRTAFVVYAMPIPPRPRVGFDPKPMLERAWQSFGTNYPPMVPAGATPVAIEGAVDGVDAYQLEGEHTVAGRTQHTSMTVVPSGENAYLLVSAGFPNDAVNKERAAILGAIHVKAPPGMWALDLGRGYYFIGLAVTGIAGLVLRLKYGISPFGWLRRSR